MIIKDFLAAKNKKIDELIVNSHLVLDETLAFDLQDWAMEKIQAVGFDGEYNLSKEGETLQNLVDDIEEALDSLLE